MPQAKKRQKAPLVKTKKTRDKENAINQLKEQIKKEQAELRAIREQEQGRLFKKLGQEIVAYWKLDSEAQLTDWLAKVKEVLPPQPDNSEEGATNDNHDGTTPDRQKNPAGHQKTQTTQQQDLQV